MSASVTGLPVSHWHGHVSTPSHTPTQSRSLSLRLGFAIPHLLDAADEVTRSLYIQESSKPAPERMDSSNFSRSTASLL